MAPSTMSTLEMSIKLAVETRDIQLTKGLDTFSEDEKDDAERRNSDIIKRMDEVIDDDVLDDPRMKDLVLPYARFKAAITIDHEKVGFVRARYQKC